MSQLDDDIRAALSDEERKLFDTLDGDAGLQQMITRPFRTKMKWWSVLAFAESIIFAGLAFWCGYEFFTATDADSRALWGISMLLCALFTAMLKMWFWMQMNLNSVISEIRRLGVIVAHSTGGSER